MKRHDATSEKHRRRRTPSADIRDLTLTRPSCAHCGSYELRVYSSRDQGDGSRLQYAHLLRCGMPQADAANLGTFLTLSTKWIS